MALQDLPSCHVELAPPPADPLDSQTAAHLDAQLDAHWLFFNRPTEFISFSPFEFRVAMGIRLLTLPEQTITLPHRCNCGRLLLTNKEVVLHSSAGCDQFSRFSDTTRHESLKHTVASVLRSYGFLLQLEPKLYSYDSTILHRPDMTVMSPCPVPVTIDFVVCAQHGEPGVNARQHAQKKNTQHGAAVRRQQHIFMPFACESLGLFDEDVFRFIADLKRTLVRHQRYHFEIDVKRAIAVSLAKSRVSRVIGSRTDSNGNFPR